MKCLKFAPPLPELVLAGTKNSTWRIDDEKDISVDDILSLCRIDGIEFAQAHVRWVKNTHFGDLTREDHE
ncbi:MAG: ASCH domain-containing protein [bacterium]